MLSAWEYSKTSEEYRQQQQQQQQQAEEGELEHIAKGRNEGGETVTVKQRAATEDAADAEEEGNKVALTDST
jgi:hypothetical protein